MRKTLACAIMALSIGVTGGHAQRISLTPDIGVYVPTSELTNLTNGQTNTLLEQQVSLSFGGKLDVWLTDRIGIQGTGTYAPSQLSVGLNGVGTATDANLFVGSGRLSYYVIPRTSIVSFLVNGGVGWLKRSGDAYAGVEDTSDLSGTVGAAVGLRLGPILSVRISGESYLYKPDFVSEALQVPSTQNDFNLSIGIGVPLLGFGSSVAN